MSGKIRRVIIIVLFLCVAIAILVTAGNLLLNHYLSREYLQEFLTGKLERKVSLEKFEAGVLTGLEMEDVDIREKDGSPWIRAKQLSVRWDWVPLLKKRVVLKSVVIRNPTVVLRRDKTGSWSFQNLLAPGEGMKKEKEFSVEVDEIAIVDAKLSLSDEAAGLELSLSGLNGRLNGLSDLGRPGFDVSVERVNGTTVNGKIAGRLDIPANRLVLTGLSVTGFDLGGVWPLVEKYTPLPLPVSVNRGILDAEIANLDLGSSYVAIKGGIRLSGYSVDYREVGHLAGDRIVLDYEGTATMDSGTIAKLELGKLGASIDDVVSVTISGELEGFRSGELKIKKGKVAGFAVLDRLIPRLPSVVRKKLPSIEVSGRIDWALDWDGPVTKIPTRVDLQLRNLSARSNDTNLAMPSLESVSGAMQLSEDRIDLEGVSGIVDNVKLDQVDGRVYGWMAADPRFDLRVELREVPVARLLEKAGEYNISPGDSVTLDGTLARVKADLKGKRDNFHYSVEVDPTGLSFEPVGAGERFTVTGGQVQVGEDDLVLDDLKIGGSSGDVSVTGKISQFKTETPELDISGTASGIDMASAVRMANVLDVEIPHGFTLSGTADVTRFRVKGKLPMPTLEANIRLNGLDIVTDRIPLPLRALRGEIEITGEMIRLREVTGTLADAPFSILGTVKFYNSPDPLVIGSIELSEVDVSSLVKVAREADSTLPLAGISLGGKVKNLVINSRGRMSRPLVSGNLQLDGVSFSHSLVPVVVRNVSGKVLFTPEKITIKDMKGSAGNAPLYLAAEVSDYLGTPRISMDFQVTNLDFREWRSSLPPSLVSDFEGLDIKGMLSAEGKISGFLKDMLLPSNFFGGEPKHRLRWEIVVRPVGLAVSHRDYPGAEVTDLTGKITVGSEKMDLTGLSFSFAGQPVEMDGTVGYSLETKPENFKLNLKTDLSNVEIGPLLQLAAELGLVDTDVEVRGTLTGGLELRGSPARPSLLGDLGFTGGTIKSERLPETVSLDKILLKFKGTSADVIEGAGHLGEAGFTLTGEITDLSAKRVSLELGVSRLSLNDAFSYLQLEPSMKNELRLEGDIGLKIRIEGGIDQSALSGKITSSNLQFRDLSIDYFEGDFSFDTPLLKLSPVNTELLGGKLQAKIDVDISAVKPSYKVVAHSRKIDMGKLFSVFGRTGTASEGELNGRITAEGLSGDIQSLTGEGQVTIDRVVLKGVPSVDSLADVLNGIISIVAGSSSGSGKEKLIGLILANTIKGARIFSSTNTSEFDRVSADFKIRKGKVISENVLAWNDDLRVSGSLELGFDKYIDARLQFIMTDTGAGKIGDPALAEFLRTEPIPLIVTGTLDNPKFHKDRVIGKLIRAYSSRDYYKDKARQRQVPSDGGDTATVPETKDAPEPSPQKLDKEEIIYDILRGMMKK